MIITRYDDKLNVMVTCDNNRQFKLIKRSYLAIALTLITKLKVTYDKEAKTVYLKAKDQETYDQIFKGIAHQIAVGAKKGQKANVIIQNG